MKSLVVLLFAQVSIPGWLVPYPGAAPQTRTFEAYTESSYITSAPAAAVLDHYRKLFESAGLPFVANSDGIGSNVRAAAPECDLLLSVRPAQTGSLVRVNCAARQPSYTTEISSTTTRTAPSRRFAATAPAPTAAEIAERHKQLVAELGIHPVYQDQPAPPLVWPAWLVHVKGARLAPSAGVDQSHREYLMSKFTTPAPMTEIFTFYEDLLDANGYRVYSSKLGTGQTISGVKQNADGYVEGANYPNGQPGPRTEIRIDFSRFYLNDPISVRIKFTTFDFKAPKR